MLKKIYISFVLAFALIFAAGPIAFSVIHAQDDEEEEQEDKDDNEDDDDEEGGDDEEENSKTYTKTIVVSPARVVIENQTQTVFLPDYDRDGIADNEDLHPDIAEMFIVKDDNSNGIVDTFEYEK